MATAIRMVLDGAKLVEAERATGVKGAALSKRLDQFNCHHPGCTDEAPCAAAIRRKGGIYTCTALEDTVFHGRTCPFYVATYPHFGR